MNKPLLSRKNRLRNGLGRNCPFIFSLVQQTLREFKRLCGNIPYEKSRRNFNYYSEVIRLAKKYAPAGESVIDIGSSETDVLERISWFSRRTALDIRYVPPRKGIDIITADFLAYDGVLDFDMVLCLQVLEHLDDPAAFARKLFNTGRHVIITVPYKWPAGMCPGHVQDPVDEARLRQWTGKDPIESIIVSDKKDRLIAVYDGNDLYKIN